MDHFIIAINSTEAAACPSVSRVFHDSTNFLKMIIMIDYTFHKATLQARQSG